MGINSTHNRGSFRVGAGGGYGWLPFTNKTKNKTPCITGKKLFGFYSFTMQSSGSPERYAKVFRVTIYFILLLIIDKQSIKIENTIYSVN